MTVRYHSKFEEQSGLASRGLRANGKMSPRPGDYSGSHLQQPLQGFNRYSDRLRVLRESRNARIGNFADIGLG